MYTYKMKRLLFLILLFPSVALAETRYRDFAVATTVSFTLRDAANVNDFLASATISTGDCLVIKDGGSAANCANTIVDESNGVYSLTLTAAEMSADIVDLIIADATASETWAAKHIVIETIGVPAVLANKRN
jgi:hypothetical protein